MDNNVDYTKPFNDETYNHFNITSFVIIFFVLLIIVCLVSYIFLKKISAEVDYVDDVDDSNKVHWYVMLVPLLAIVIIACASFMFSYSTKNKYSDEQFSQWAKDRYGVEVDGRPAKEHVGYSGAKKHYKDFSIGNGEYAELYTVGYRTNDIVMVNPSTRQELPRVFKNSVE